MDKARFHRLVERYSEFFDDPKTVESFQLRKGAGPVMISAPHSVVQTREGKPKYAEPQTGVLACVLSDSLGCPIIYKTLNDGDANYDPICAYKTALAEYLKTTPTIQVLLDLHQLAPEREIMVDIGTGKNRNTLGDSGLAETISKAFKAQGIEPVGFGILFGASYPHTISSYVSRECGIPAVQIEMNSRLFFGDSIPSGFRRTYEALENIVRKLWSKYGYER